MNTTPEQDWKFLSGIKEELLEALSRRMNDELRAVLADTKRSEYEKRGAIYELVFERDKDVARGFDDWRRNTITNRCLYIHELGLLKPEHIARLTPGLQETLRAWDRDRLRTRTRSVK